MSLLCMCEGVTTCEFFTGPGCVYDRIPAGLPTSVALEEDCVDDAFVGFYGAYDVFADGTISGKYAGNFGGGVIDTPHAIYQLNGDVNDCAMEANPLAEFDCITDALGRWPLVTCQTAFGADCDDALVEATECMEDELGEDHIEVCSASFCD